MNISGGAPESVQSSSDVTLAEIRSLVVTHRVALTSNIPNSSAFQGLTDAVYKVYSGTGDAVGIEESLVYLERIRQGGGGMVEDAKFLRKMGERIRMGKEVVGRAEGGVEKEDVMMEIDSIEEGANVGDRFTPDSMDKENTNVQLTAPQAPSTSVVKVETEMPAQVVCTPVPPAPFPPPPSPPPRQHSTSSTFDCLGHSWEQYETEEGWEYYLRDDGWSQWEDPRVVGDLIVKDAVAEESTTLFPTAPEATTMLPPTPGVPKGRPRRKDKGLALVLGKDVKKEIGERTKEKESEARQGVGNYFKPSSTTNRGLGKGGYGVVVKAAADVAAKGDGASTPAKKNKMMMKKKVKTASMVTSQMLTTPIPELEEILRKSETEEDRKKKEWTMQAKRRLWEYRKKQKEGEVVRGKEIKEKEERDRKVEEVVETMKGIRLRVSASGPRRVGLRRNIQKDKGRPAKNMKKANNAKEERAIREGVEKAKLRIKEVRREMEWKERDEKERGREKREEKDRKRRERIERNRREREKRQMEERERWERNERREEILCTREWKDGEFGGGRRTELEGLNAAMGERLREHFKDNARDRREQGDWYTQYVEMEETGPEPGAPSQEIVYDIIPDGVKMADVGGGRGMYGNSVVVKGFQSDDEEDKDVNMQARQQRIEPAAPEIQFVKMQLNRWGDKQREVKKVMDRVGRMQEELERLRTPKRETQDDADIRPLSTGAIEWSEEDERETVKFTILKANGLPTLLGETKAYCTVKFEHEGKALGEEKRTQVKRGTDVLWNETFTFPRQPGCFTVFLWSKNVFVSDDFIGSFELRMEEIKGGKSLMKEVKGREDVTQGLCTIVGGGVLDDLI